MAAFAPMHIRGTKWYLYSILYPIESLGWLFVVFGAYNLLRIFVYWHLTGMFVWYDTTYSALYFLAAWGLLQRERWVMYGFICNTLFILFTGAHALQGDPSLVHHLGLFSAALVNLLISFILYTQRFSLTHSSRHILPGVLFFALLAINLCYTVVVNLA